MAKTKRHTSLRVRFTLLVSAVLLITFVVIAYFLVRNDQRNDVRNINKDTVALATLATPQIGSTYDTYSLSGSIKISEQIQTYTALDSNIVNVAIVGLNGNTIFESNNSYHTSDSNGDSFNTQYTYNSDGFITKIIVPYFDVYGQHPYSIAYDVNPSVLNSDNQKQISDIILFSFVGLVVTSALMYELIYRIYIKPIEKVSHQAILISQGNYDTTVDVIRKDEIGDLAQSVNTMSERLKADIVSLKELDRLKSEFITIASHNLRTPLAIISGNVEILHSKDMPREISDPLRAIEESSDELANFAEDMLTISAIEAGNNTADKTQMTLESLTVPLKDRFSKMAAEKGITLLWYIGAPETSILVSAIYTQNTIKNLLDNAIKFTEKGGTVSCRIVLENKSLYIIVQDTGIGIAPEEQGKLFTKFHRGTSTLDSNYQGVGIGLYVAKLMTDAQHGTIKFTSEPGKGSVFTVTIPQPM